MILNNIKDIKLGERQIDRVYRGSNLIWKYEVLPTGYQKVKCIYPKANNAISSHYDTRVILTNNSEVTIDYQTIEFNNGTTEETALNTFLFGSRSSATSRSFIAMASYLNHNTQWDFSNYQMNRYTSSTDDYDRHTMKVNNQSYNLDGVNVKNIVPSTFTTPASCWVFGVTESRFVNNLPPRTKIYSFSIKENGELICDLVPCYRILDNEVGFYDKVRDIFLQPSASDVFVYDL